MNMSPPSYKFRLLQTETQLRRNLYLFASFTRFLHRMNFFTASLTILDYCPFARMSLFFNSWISHLSVSKVLPCRVKLSLDSRVYKSPLRSSYHIRKYLMWWAIYMRVMGNLFCWPKKIFRGPTKGVKPKQVEFHSSRNYMLWVL